MTIRNEIPSQAIGVNIQSSGIVEEEQIYVLPDDEINEDQILGRKTKRMESSPNRNHIDPENAVFELQQFH